MSLRASVDDFERAFEGNMPKFRTQRAAYDATEAQHEQMTGTRRYSDFTSFRNVHNRRRGKRR